MVLENAGEKTLTQFVRGIRGNSDRSRVQTGLNDDTVRSVMAQLFKATEYLHMNNICHRDMKPDNIMVTHVPSAETASASGEDGCLLWQPLRVKLIDFNVAV